MHENHIDLTKGEIHDERREMKVIRILALDRKENERRIRRQIIETIKNKEVKVIFKKENENLEA